jgi:hypothetical protein
MLPLAPLAALAALSAGSLPEELGLRSVGAVAQATATVRIVSGSAIRFDEHGHFRTEGRDRNPKPKYRSTLTLGGTQVPAVIAEFE